MEVNGDIAASGRILAGGGINAGGESTFRGNVSIEGMLLAKNIRVPCVGLYATEGELRGAVPYPIAGMWAFVGTGFPARIYRVSGGRWTDTGHDGSVEFAVYTETLESGLSDLRGQMAVLQASEETLRQRMAELTSGEEAWRAGFEERIRTILEEQSRQSAESIDEIARTIESLAEAISENARQAADDRANWTAPSGADAMYRVPTEGAPAGADAMYRVPTGGANTEEGEAERIAEALVEERRLRQELERTVTEELLQLNAQMDNFVMCMGAMQEGMIATISEASANDDNETLNRIENAQKDIAALREEINQERETRSISDNKLLRWLRHEVWVRRCQYWRLLKVIAECYRAIQNANEAADRANKSTEKLEAAIKVADDALTAALEAKANADSAAEEARKAGDAAMAKAEQAARQWHDRIEEWIKSGDARIDVAISRIEKQNDAAMRDVAEAAERANAAAERAEAAAERAEQATDALEIPEEMEVEVPGPITLGNRVEQRIKATLTPGGSHNVLCMVSEGDSVKVLPDGQVVARKAGITQVHVIPPRNVGIYKTVEVIVKDPEIRLTSAGMIRMAGERIRKT